MAEQQSETPPRIPSPTPEPERPDSDTTPQDPSAAERDIMYREALARIDERLRQTIPAEHERITLRGHFKRALAAIIEDPTQVELRVECEQQELRLMRRDGLYKAARDMEQEADAWFAERAQ